MIKPKNAKVYRDYTGIKFIRRKGRRYYKYRFGRGDYEWIRKDQFPYNSGFMVGSQDFYEQRVGW